MQAVVISALLAEAMPKGSELWWYCRGIDPKGSGRVVINFAKAAEELGLAYGTVCRWFNSCRDSVQNGDRYLFRVLQRKHGEAVVMLKSLQRLKLQFSVEDVGGCGEVFLHELKDIRYHATDLQVEYAQRCSLYAALAAAEGVVDGKRVNDPEGVSRGFRPDLEKAEQELIAPIFERTQSHNWGAEKSSASMIWIGDRCVFVKPDFALHGVSQETLGESLGRSRQAVNRRLSAKPRIKRGLKLVDRRQIARQDLDQSFNMLRLGPADIGVDHELAAELPRFFGCSNRLWRSEANLYWVPVQLVRKSHWRKTAEKDQGDVS